MGQNVSVLIAALGLLPSVLSPAPAWYGPATVTFRVGFGGNPYDPAQNDVRVKFLGPEGEPIERIAYFDADENAWKAVLVAPVPGKYVAKLYRNGAEKMQAPEEGLVEVSQKLGGYIRIDPNHPRRLEKGDGTPYIPLGFNLGWQGDKDIPMADQLDKMSKVGVNWTRIWACHWDGKNPWWPQEDPQASADGLWEPALEKWSKVISKCETNGVAFQMVLFHHGAFSSRVNPNWPDHPWNSAKGGFLKDAANFFTDAEAKRRSKMWLRYAVARFGHSPSLLAWELFNEVEWVDARYANRWPDIEKWHGEMADYVRSIDPYHHLITTSSAVDRKDLWTKMDYLQPHIYTPSVFAGVSGAEQPSDKPMFFGEFGAEDMNSADPRQVARDGILGGILANQAGAGQFWYWDLVESKNLYDEYQKASQVILQSGFADHPTARPISLAVRTPNLSTLSLIPGLGWAKSEVTELDLSAEAKPTQTARLSAYIQGQSGGNREMFPGPLRLRVNATKPGTLRIVLNGVAKNGTNIFVNLDGKTIAQKTFAASAEDATLTETLSIPFSAGSHIVELANPGGDWVHLQRIEVPDFAPEGQVTALADPNWLMMRLQSPAGAASKQIEVVGLPIPDGPQTFRLFDMDSGSVSTRSVVVSGGKASFSTIRDGVLVWKG